MAAAGRLKIGIISFGPFAQFLARTMIKHGRSLVATSRSDHSRLCSHMGIPFLQGCRMIEMSCEEHDRIAAKTQFLTHTVGRLNPRQLTLQGFEKLLQVKCSSVADSVDLYVGLFQHNKFAREELEKLELAFQAVKSLLIQKASFPQFR